MVSIVLPDAKLANFCIAMADENMQTAILSLISGPLDKSQMAALLRKTPHDVEAEINTLVALGLIRRVRQPNSDREMYALEFSMGRLSKHQDAKMVGELSEEISEVIYNFLEEHAEEITGSCSKSGASLGREVEQLLLAAFSKIMEQYGREIRAEDQRLCKASGEKD